jgi:hypothetical protein
MARQWIRPAPDPIQRLHSTLSQLHCAASLLHSTHRLFLVRESCGKKLSSRRIATRNKWMPDSFESEAEVQEIEAIVAQRAAVSQTGPIHNTTYNIIHVHQGNYYLNTRIVNSDSGRSILGNPKSMRKFPSFSHFFRRWGTSSPSMRTSPGIEVEFLIVYLAATGVRQTRQKTKQKSENFSTSVSSLIDAQAEVASVIEAPPLIEPAAEPVETKTVTIMSDTEGREEDGAYVERGREFFKEGRLFKVAKADDPLHLKQYILLDRNDGEHGPCLEVLICDESDRSTTEAYFLRSHVHVQPHENRRPDEESSEDSGSKKRRVVYLDEYSEVEEGTYVKLGWTANIPFEGFRYKDCGELDRRYLRELRGHYADWLKYYWDLD